MKKAACLILGTCLTLHVPANFASGAQKAALRKGSLPSPLHRFEHTGGVATADDVNADQYANFVLATVQTLLPENQKGSVHRITEALISEANRQGFDPLLLVSVIRHESRFNPNAIGRHGEIGLMQIKPKTALWLGERAGLFSKKSKDAAPSEESLKHMLQDPAFNIRIGTTYLAHLRAKFKGDGFLAAYNMGPGLLLQHLKNRTRPHEYSNKVFANYMQLTELYFSESAPDFEHKVASISSFN